MINPLNQPSLTTNCPSFVFLNFSPYLDESATTLPRYIPMNPKKRMFTGSGSSSAACEEGEVLEIPPPAMDRSSKPKFFNQKEKVLSSSSDGVSGLADEESVDNISSRHKILTSSSDGVSASADEESGDNISPLSDSAELEDSDEDLYFGEDECNDAYYDDMLFNDNDNLEAHFDHMELPPGVEAPVPWLVGSPKNETKVATASTSTYTGNSLRGGMKKVEDEIVRKFENFAKFDTVQDFTDHHYGKYKSAAMQTPKNWSKRIQEEWEILRQNLPAEIYVRAYETRMNLLRAVIIGAQGTPYHDGLFFFDVYFPSDYPQIPPEVYYHSGGLRINPNLYCCGKVCLSLLNTWPGTGKENWNPKESTILQVLVSIQGLILNAQPYFNEPGYEAEKGTKRGEESSSAYNEKTFMHSLKTMVYSMQRPPKYFEDFVVGYFRKNARYILVSCVACLNGAPLGGLVSEEDGKSCSEQLRSSISTYITRLVQTFTEIGADGCQDFLSSAKKTD